MAMDLPIARVLDGIRNGDHSILQEVYKVYRERFVAVTYRKYGKRFSVKELTDEFQECVASFYECVVTDPEFTIRKSIGGYLIQMGLYRLYHKSKDRGKFEPLNAMHAEDASTDPDEEESSEHRLAVVWKRIRELEEPGPTILKWFYIDRKSYDEISRDLKAEFDLEIKPGALRTRKNRYLEVLRNRLSV